MFRILFILTFFAAGAAHAQFTYYVHELKWDDETRSWLGMVNPGNTTQRVAVTCYSDNGSELGLFQMDLLPRRSREISAEELIIDGNPTWTRIDSTGQIAGYVRYSDVQGGRMSAAPFSYFSGSETWLPQLGSPADDVGARTILVNTSATQGNAYFNPVRLVDDQLQKTGDPVAVPNFGAPYQRADLAYGSAFERTDNLVWDHLSADGNLSLSAAHHFIGDDNAAIVLNRTPNRRMIVGPLQPRQGSTWNKLVLVNTYPGKLPVSLTAHYGYYGDTDLVLNGPVTIELDMEAYEQRTFDIDTPTQLNLPANATWYEVIPHEGGLIGYQLFGTEDGSMLAALESATVPTSLNTLPYTPSTNELATDIAVINPGDTNAFVHILGFDHKGLRQSQVISRRLRPFEKWEVDTDSLFGSRAQRVTWVQTMQSRGELISYSVIKRRDGNGMAALQGIPSYAKAGDLFKADFDHLNLTSMETQGWEHITFNEGGFLEPGEILALRSRYGPERNLPGEFYIEHSFDGVDGFFYLGYDPFNSDIIAARGNGEVEQVALVSPWVEVPQFGTWYVSYYMRFFNPELSTRLSNYGLVWQEDGSKQWNWFGLNGRQLLNPDGIVGGRWAPIQWRNEIVTVTDWLPFQTTLPDSVRGKRIRLGYYYEFDPDQIDDKAPWLWLDRVRITTQPLKRYLYYGPLGSGSFEYNPE